MKMKVVDLDTGKTPNEPYDLSTLAGGNPTIDQIPICSTAHCKLDIERLICGCVEPFDYGQVAQTGEDKYQKFS
jgi:hypothetical protein